MVSVKIDFRKRDFVWISLAIVLIGVGLVMSIGSGDYTVHGHDAGELDVSGIGGGLAFGDWVDKSSDYGAQQAATDGIVVVMMDALTGMDLRGYTGDSSSTLILRHREETGTSNRESHSFTMPIRKGDYWEVTANKAVSVWWIPIVGVTPDTAGFDPVSYSGGESVTFPNGMIMKMGESSSTGTVTINFDTSFPGGLKSVIVQPIGNVGGSLSHGEEIHSSDEDGFVYGIHGNYDGFYWTAIGY